MGDRLAQGWDKAKAEVAEANAETPEGAAPGEVPAEAAPAAEVPAVEAPATETPAEVPAEAVVPGDEFKFDLDDTGDVGDPAAFFNEVKKDPATEKFFNDHPELKNAVAGALRRDNENREIRQYAPTVEAAKQMSEAAATFQTFDNSFLTATTPEGAQEFLNHWVREAMFLDDKGQPILENGQYKLHPALTYVFDHIAGNKMSVWGNEAKSNGHVPQQLAPLLDGLRDFAVLQGDERLQAAANVIREAMTPSSPALDEIPEALKPLADSLKKQQSDLQAEKDASARRTREEQQAAHHQSIDRAETKAATSVRDQLKPRLANSGLTAFEQTSALREIGEAIDSAFGHKGEDGKWTAGAHASARMFQSVYDSISQQPAGEAREKALTKHILTYTNQVLGPITTKVIRAAKNGTLERQPEKQAKVTAQTTASSTDPRGTSVSTPSPQSLSPAQLRAQVIDDFKKAHNGEEPDREYVMKEGARRMNLFGLK
jgi:hypothetical protein